MLKQRYLTTDAKPKTAIRRILIFIAHQFQPNIVTLNPCKIFVKITRNVYVSYDIIIVNREGVYIKISFLEFAKKEMSFKTNWMHWNVIYLEIIFMGLHIHINYKHYCYKRKQEPHIVVISWFDELVKYLFVKCYFVLAPSVYTYKL